MDTLSRDGRLQDSRSKIHAPFRLDDSLRFYSPQENVAAFDHPRVRAWHAWVEREWEPPTGAPGTSRIALVIPCTKHKPYAVSREHRGINGALLSAAWEPTEASGAPAGLVAALDPGESPHLLNERPLRKGDVYLDRIVVSEPLGLVPYTEIYRWRGEQSPACSYDDPGLFEGRGTAVSPWLPGCTAEPVGDGRWRWGPAERDAFVDAHDRLRVIIGSTLTRVRPRYGSIVAWVSPGLTHRSFLADDAQRRAEHLPRSKVGLIGTRRLRGVLDDHPGLVTVLPTFAQLQEARGALRDRLAREGRPSSEAAARGIYARGDGHDTPLGLPESLEHLVAHLDWLASGR